MPGEVSAPATDISLFIPAWNVAEFLPGLLDTIDAAREHYRHGHDRVEVIVEDNDWPPGFPPGGSA